MVNCSPSNCRLREVVTIMTPWKQMSKDLFRESVMDSWNKALMPCHLSATDKGGT